MFVDCHTCPVRGRACDDCAVGVLLEADPGLPLDADEQRALEMFIDAGLVDRREALRVRARTEPWSRARVG